MKRMLRARINPTAMRAFSEELLLMSSLRHPNIVQVVVCCLCNCAIEMVVVVVVVGIVLGLLLLGNPLTTKLFA
jgi:hypothetical protein